MACLKKKVCLIFVLLFSFIYIITNFMLSTYYIAYYEVKEEYKVEAADVRAYVLKQDKRRAAFYEHFSDRVWGKAENFHLSINSTIGLDTTVDLILALARERGLNP